MCKTHQVRSTLEIEMSEKCTPLWREAHVEVKSGKNCGFGAFLDVRMSICVAGTRDSAPCQKLAKREGFVAASTTTTTLHYTPLHYNYNYNYDYNHATFHYTTLHYTNYITLHYTPMHYNYNYNYNHNYKYKYNYITLHYTNYNYNCNYNYNSIT